MTLSILHRVTGVALSIGLIALVVWLQSIAFGAKPYAEVSALMSTLIGRT
jgi:succinate dehydrogenase / fumarate reductase cytochrome b subunit